LIYVEIMEHHVGEIFLNKAEKVTRAMKERKCRTSNINIISALPWETVVRNGGPLSVNSQSKNWDRG